MLSLLPRSTASVANLFEHIPASFTVSLIMLTTSLLLITSHNPSLAITCSQFFVITSCFTQYYSYHNSNEFYRDNSFNLTMTLLTKYSSSADKVVSVISGSAVTAGFRSSSPMERVTCEKDFQLTSQVCN